MSIDKAEPPLAAGAGSSSREIRDRTSLYLGVFERAASGIALADLDGQLLESNAAFQQLVGFNPRELLHLSFKALTHPDEHAFASAEFRDLLEGRREGIEVMQRLIHKDGHCFWSQTKLSLVKDTAGKPLFCVAVVNDVTEQRRESERLSVQLAMCKILAATPTVNNAIVQVMQALCKTLDWQIGEFWTPETAGGLRRQVSWQVAGFNAAEFNMFGQQFALHAGEGLPGKVWADDAAIWISDVRGDDSFMRRRPAQQAGIKGALAFPVRCETGMLGVFTFSYRDFRHSDDALLNVLTEMGGQLGLFIANNQAG